MQDQAATVAFTAFARFVAANEDEMRTLLGGVSADTLAQAVSDDTRTRISRISALWVDLAECHPDPDVARQWIHEPHAKLAGRSPWQAMLSGDIAGVRALLK